MKRPLEEIIEDDKVVITDTTKTAHKKKVRRYKPAATSDVTITSPLESNDLMKNMKFFSARSPHGELQLIRTPAYEKINDFIITEINKDEDESDVFVLSGPPGCGKTVACASLITMMACADEDDTAEYLWIDVPGKKYVKIVNRRMSVPERFDISSPPHFTNETILVFYDGVAQSTLEDSLELMKALNDEAEDKKIHFPFQVVITSQQALDLVKPLADRCKLTSTVKIINPWTLDNYYDAVKNDVFFEEVKAFLGTDKDYVDSPEARKRLIDEKFLVAGTCPRFMFDMTAEKVMEVIRTKFYKIDDIEKIYNRNAGCDAAVNTIVQFIYEDDELTRVVLVSSYVSRLIATRLEPAKLERFLLLARKNRNEINPALDGWLLELEFLALLRSAQGNPQVLVGRLTAVNNSEPVTVTIHDYDKFHSSKDFKKEDLKLGNNVLYIPKVYNQGGFDAVVCENDRLRFFQVTRAIGHSLKLQYMTAFLQEFNRLRSQRNLDNKDKPAFSTIVSFDVTFVVPTNIVFNPPSGASIEGWPAPKLTALYGTEIPLSLPAKKEDIYRVVKFRRIGE